MNILLSVFMFSYSIFIICTPQEETTSNIIPHKQDASTESHTNLPEKIFSVYNSLKTKSFELFPEDKRHTLKEDAINILDESFFPLSLLNSAYNEETKTKFALFDAKQLGLYGLKELKCRAQIENKYGIQANTLGNKAGSFALLACIIPLRYCRILGTVALGVSLASKKQAAQFYPLYNIPLIDNEIRAQISNEKVVD